MPGEALRVKRLPLIEGRVEGPLCFSRSHAIASYQVNPLWERWLLPPKLFFLFAAKETVVSACYRRNKILWDDCLSSEAGRRAVLSRDFSRVKVSIVVSLGSLSFHNPPAICIAGSWESIMSREVTFLVEFCSSRMTAHPCWRQSKWRGPDITSLSVCSLCLVLQHLSGNCAVRSHVLPCKLHNVAPSQSCHAGLPPPSRSQPSSTHLPLKQDQALWGASPAPSSRVDPLLQ